MKKRINEEVSKKDLGNLWKNQYGPLEKKVGEIIKKYYSPKSQQMWNEAGLIQKMQWIDQIVAKYGINESSVGEAGQLNEQELNPSDGQPKDNWYVPSVMVERDAITNILSRYSPAGITHTFQGDDLVITAGDLSPLPQDKIIEALRIEIAEVIKKLKEEYKNATSKTLAIGKEESSTFDSVANYTTDHRTLCRLTCIYELPASLAEDDAGSEKAEIRGNIPVFHPKTK